jgi:dTDP-4-dehydrorhamnose reductase
MRGRGGFGLLQGLNAFHLANSGYASRYEVAEIFLERLERLSRAAVNSGLSGARRRPIFQPVERPGLRGYRARYTALERRMNRYVMQ